MKKIASLFIVFQLFMVPVGDYAQMAKAADAAHPATKAKASNGSQSLNSVDMPLENNLTATLSHEKGVGTAIGDTSNYTDERNYPLVDSGMLTAKLWDYYSNYHSIYFQTVTAQFPSDDMNLFLKYKSDKSTDKDSNVRVEFFKGNGRYLELEGSTTFNTYGYNSIYLNSVIPKENFQNQPYLYIRFGVLKNGYDSYYAAAATFKVANPYFFESAAPTEKFAVISNESLETNGWEGTGDFGLKDINAGAPKGLKASSYQLDVNKRFEAQKANILPFKNNMYSIQSTYSIGDSTSFWVTNQQNDLDYQINARLAYQGKNANIWVNNYQISDSDAARMGREFDEKIHPMVNGNFGVESDVDHDGRVNILCFDIQDGFTGSGGYIGGYFWSRDLYKSVSSNQSEILYIDTYPSMGKMGEFDVTKAYPTMAHEFQHMVNYNEKVLVEKTSETDTWIDEGLSMAAEQIYSGAGLADRVDYFNQSTAIQNGKSLLKWEEKKDVLSNYALSYLFLQYVKYQANQGDRIFGEILRNPNSNYKAIEDVAKKYISPSMTFGKLMTDFRVALFLKKSTGLYGFKGEPFFNTLNPKIYTGTNAYIPGGGAIVTNFNVKNGNTVPLQKGLHINYTIVGNPLDTVAPESPKVNAVTDSAIELSGTAEANESVVAMVGKYEIGRAASNSVSGDFALKIPLQPAGTVIQVYAEDAAGNISNAASVTVRDLTAPELPIVYGVGSKDTVVSGSAEAASTVTVKVDGVVIGTTVVKEDGGFDVAIQLQRPGTALEVTATDSAGNVSGVIKTIVKDTDEPVIHGAADSVIQVGDAFDVMRGVTALDNVDGDLTSVVAVEGVVNSKKKGSYTLTYTVSDEAGNTVTITRNITVVDTVKPVIAGATAKTIKINTAFNPLTGVTAKDNADGNLTALLKVSGTVNLKKKGTYTLTYTVTDKSGNKTAVARKITVK